MRILMAKTCMRENFKIPNLMLPKKKKKEP
jgi:hypothetical protein